jgi:hypothetical protein
MCSFHFCCKASIATKEYLRTWDVLAHLYRLAYTDLRAVAGAAKLRHHMHEEGS